jgi:hypothetical protein
MYWIVLARLVAEAGVFMSQGPWPVDEVVTKAVGTQLPLLGAAGSVKTLTLLGFLKSVTLKWYTIMPAYILGGFKFAERQKINARRLVVAMLLAILVAIVAGFVISIYLNYSYGALNLSEWKARSLALEPFEMIRSYENAPKGSDLKSLMVMAVGAIVTLFLSAMRMNFTWWPFHPLGYIASNLYLIHYFWIHIFLGWVGVKLITKYGGVHLLRRIRPFLIGMVLGGFMSGGFWWILDYVYHLDTHWVYSV